MRNFVALLAIGYALQAPTAIADHVVWFNPAGVKITDNGGVAFGTPSTPEAIRIQHTGAPQPHFGTVSIPLSVRSDVTLDSVYLCYRTTPGDVGPSRITAITLSTMALPTATSPVFSDATPRQSTAGECLGLNVSDVTPFGSPAISISMDLPVQTFVEIGAIGLKFTTTFVGINSTDPIETPSLAIAPGRPNPFSPGTRIDYGLSESAHARLQIVDVAGRVVRTLVDRTLAAGNYREWWDGRDDRGHALAPGVYFSRVSTERESQTQRLVRLD